LANKLNQPAGWNLKNLPQRNRRLYRTESQKTSLVLGLVLVMIVFHCASVTRQVSFDVITENLRFLHSAFVLMAGYLYGIHYYPQLSSRPGQVQRRLLIRSCKLLLLFVGVNVGLTLVGFNPSIKELRAICPDAGAFVDTCVLNMRDGIAAYEILYYLTVFLMLLGLTCRMRTLLPLLILLLGVEFVKPCYVAWFSIFGMFGGLLGIVVNRYQSFLQRVNLGNWYSIAPVMLALELGITSQFKMETHSLVVMLLILLETGLWFGTFLFVTSLISQKGSGAHIKLLGKYTLVAYMIQMPIVRVVYWVCTRFEITGYVYYACAIVAVGILTVCAVGLLKYLRETMPTVDSAYNVIFV
jgi:hypothetical protein